MLMIELIDRGGNVLSSASGADDVWLCADRVYQEGDCIRVTGAKHLRVQMDRGIGPADVCAPGAAMTWRVPAGEHRLAYAPGLFESPRHLVHAAVIPPEALHVRRNLALNPADLRGDTDFYPHCTANVETRDEACFCARNVIDGIRINTFHGEWPYQSWGIGARKDAWCRLDFGRDVRVDAMALTLRADFPHDAWWTQGTVVLSDGAEMTFPLEKTADRQTIPLGGHVVRWLRLERLIKCDVPSAFPALRQWEVYGVDL